MSLGDRCYEILFSGSVTVPMVNLTLICIVLVTIVVSKVSILNPGKYDISEMQNTVKIVSHTGFNKKSKYKHNMKSTWKFVLGSSCTKMEVFCLFMQTMANKKCSQGDILSMVGKGQRSTFCRNKKPEQKKPKIYNGDLTIIWKTDNKKAMKGFDCRVKCKERLRTTTTTSTTTTGVMSGCFTSLGPAKGKPCVFPFKWTYTGQTYDGCAFDPTLNPLPWCSTKTINGVHQGGKGEWGYCHASCPLATGMSTPSQTTPPPTVAPGIAAGCKCGKVRKHSRIISGEETEVNEYPWMAGITVAGGVGPFCGGALISDQYVLTAGHCCKGRTADSIQVFLGDHNWNTNEDAESFRRTIQKIKIHPLYGKSKRLNFDVCLLKLSNPISFPDHPNVSPICLPTDKSDKYEDRSAIIAGWGKMEGDGKVSKYLQDAHVKILKQNLCKRAFGSAVTNAMLCISRHVANLGSVCNGDSGGSLMLLNEESMETVGIVSWGVPKCLGHKPSVMARITAALAWIKKDTADSNFCPRS